MYNDEAKRLNAKPAVPAGNRKIPMASAPKIPPPLGPKNVSDLITKMVRMLPDYSHLEVVIVSLNSFVRHEKLDENPDCGENDFIAPAELGLVRFSIQDGIIDSKHLVFNGIEIPPGIFLLAVYTFDLITISF